MRHVLVVVVALHTGTAFAGPGDWLNRHGDWGFTARAEGTADIGQPVQAWRVLAGGGVGDEGLLVFDVDGDNVDELITASAGKVQCRSLNGAPLWETAPNGIDILAGRDDFDGDGIDEIVALRGNVPATLYLVDSATGEIEYRNAFAEIGAVDTRAFAKGDLDGDGKPDLLVKPRQPHYAMHAIHHDNVNGYEELWQTNLSHTGYANIIEPIIADLDGDSTVEVTVQQGPHIQLFTVVDGAAQSRISDMFLSHNFGLMRAVDVDADTFDELVVVGNDIYDHAVSVIDPQRSGNELVWQLHYVPTDETAVIYRASSVGDLDGDGSIEIIVSVYNDTDTELDGPAGTAADHDGVNHPNGWATLVLDAATGSTLAHLVGVVFEETLIDAATSQPLIVVSQGQSGLATLPPFSSLSAFQFDGSALVPAAGWSQLAHASLVRCQNVHRPLLDQPGYQGTSARACTLEADAAAGREVLVQIDQDDDGLGETVSLLRQSDGSQVASRTVETGFRVLAADIAFDVMQPLGLLVDHSDGNVEVWDPTLVTQAQVSITSGAHPFAVANLGGASTHNELMLTLANGELAVFDLERSSPELVWTYSGGTTQTARIIDHDGVNQHEILVVDRSDPLNTVVEIRQLDALYADSLVGAAQLTGYAADIVQAVPADLNGSGTADLLVMVDDNTRAEADRRRLIAINGNGTLQILTEMWNVPVDYRSGVLRAADVANGTNDAVDDALVWYPSGLQLLNGVDGADAVSAFPTTLAWVDHAIVDDLGSSTGKEVAAAGYTGIGAWSVVNDLEFYRESPQFGCEHCGGNFVACDVDAVVGKDVVRTNPWGEISAREGATGMLVWQRQALGGIIAATQPERVALHAPVAGDIDNDGMHEVLFGSDDGYLYAINAEDGSLVWAHNLQVAPVHLALGNIDGDIDLEIVAALADGSLIAIDSQHLAATTVRDLEIDVTGASFVSSHDVDLLEWSVRVGVGWNAVPAAGSVDYLVWVETELGTPVSDPLIVSDVTELIVPTQALTVGQHYRSAVQPSDSGGWGPIAHSDGFLMVDLSAPTILSFNVDPPVLAMVGDEVNITAALVDPTGLSGYRIEVLDQQSQLVYVDEQPVTAQQYDLATTWDGQDTGGQYLPRGDYTIVLSGSDLAGRTSGNGTRLVTLAWELLSAPTITAPAAGAIVTTATPAFVGTGGADHSIAVMENGNTLCTAVADIGGNFTCTAMLPMAEGPHTVYANAGDAMGDVSPDGTSVEILIDTLAPIPPVITAPVTGEYSVQDYRRPSVDGVAYEAGLAIEVMLDDNLLCSAGPTAAPTFFWSCTGDDDFVVGSYELTAFAIDAAGHRSIRGAAVVFTLVEPAPAPKEDGGGCACSSSTAPSLAWTLLLLGLARRRQLRRSA